MARCSTGVVSCRQQQPFTTCSLASTVPHSGHQFKKRFFAIGQAALEHLQKEPLIPAVVFGLAGGDFAIPVDREPQALHLRLHVGDVAERPLARIAAFFQRGVFGRQSEGVPAHRMQNVVAAHPHVARQRIADRVIAHVAHVQLAARIRQHLEHVVLRLIGSVRYVERRVVRPTLVPLGLDFFGVERFFGNTSSFNAVTLRRSSPGLSTGVSRMKAFFRSSG